MPSFRWIAIDGAGVVQRGVMEAANEAEVVGQLQRRGRQGQKHDAGCPGRHEHCQRDRQGGRRGAGADREAEELLRLTGWENDRISKELVAAQGPGNIVVLELEYEAVTEVFTGVGEHGVKAETVSRRAVDAMRKYLASDVPVGEYLADQLLLLMGISAWQTGEESTIRTTALTRHSSTQVDVLRQCLGVTTSVARSGEHNTVEVSVKRQP